MPNRQNETGKESASLAVGRRQGFERGAIFSKIPDFHGQFQRCF
jgi:hypothetical protein